MDANVRALVKEIIALKEEFETVRDGQKYNGRTGCSSYTVCFVIYVCSCSIGLFIDWFVNRYVVKLIVLLLPCDRIGHLLAKKVQTTVSAIVLCCL